MSSVDLLEKLEFAKLIKDMARKKSQTTTKRLPLAGLKGVWIQK